jgi:hypothetical protein
MLKAISETRARGTMRSKIGLNLAEESRLIYVNSWNWKVKEEILANELP